MKIAMAQINPTVGDFGGNLELVERALAEAREQGTELCVFPEMALSGYPPHDLLERPRFVAENLEALERVAGMCRDLAAVIGHVRPNPGEVGKRLLNAAALVGDGRVLSVHAKTLLPTYDVFDERRYFEPAAEVRPVEFRGLRLGITLCEDSWNVPGVFQSRLYERDPVSDLVEAGADLIINVSASPFTLSKRASRPEMLRSTAVRHGRPLVFVNQVGGNDDLVFDGRSEAFAADGTTLARAAELREDLLVFELESGGEVRDVVANDQDAVLEALELGLRDYAAKCGFASAVLGLSGGIDSALVAVIAARALGAENVLGVAMPSRYSSEGSVRDAEQLARNLGIGFEVVPIDEVYQKFLEALESRLDGEAPGVTEENIQARVRGVVLMALSNREGHLLLTTGNKSELAVGYCTLYGDMAGGLAVISDLPKTMVYRMAERINEVDEKETIPREILEKPPSAELAPGQRDQDNLPPYELLDAVLTRHVDERMDVASLVEQGFDERLVRRVARMVRANEHKRRQAPPGIKVNSKAFGFGRRFPLAQKWPG